MADQSLEISDKAVGRLPYAKEGQYKGLDTELKGFVVVIGRRKKTFAAQGAFWRDGVREFAARKKIGEFGDMTSREARAKAKDILAAIAKGQRPGDTAPIRKGAVTLREAWDRYRSAHMLRKGRSEGNDRELQRSYGAAFRRLARQASRSAGPTANACRGAP